VRGRRVLWICGGVAVVAAVLFSVLAMAGPASQTTASSPLLGKPAPAITGAPLGGGGQISLSQFTGRWVLVNFAASWCVPCQQEMPQLLSFAAASAHNGPGGPLILTVAYDEQDVVNLRAFLTSRGATWPAVDAPGSTVTYGLKGVPESFLVDPQGAVVEHITGGLNATQIEQFIGRYSSGGQQ
jgi:cytochrome c biogenesis protein CcmG, thiol:disulfide interchange protein DsbE